MTKSRWDGILIGSDETGALWPHDCVVNMKAKTTIAVELQYLAQVDEVAKVVFGFKV